MLQGLHSRAVSLPTKQQREERSSLVGSQTCTSLQDRIEDLFTSTWNVWRARSASSFQGSGLVSHFILCSFDSSFHQHVSSSSTMTTDDDESYMQLALDVARRALDLGEVPVGCVIVWNQSPHGRVVVSHGANQVNATRDGAYNVCSAICQSSFRPAGSDTARQPHDTPSWSPSIACSRSRPRRTNSDSRQPFWPGPHAPTCCHLHRRCCCRMETNARKLGRIGSSSTRVTAGGPTMDFTQRQSWPSAIST